MTATQMWILAGIIPLTCSAQSAEIRESRDAPPPPQFPILSALDADNNGEIDAKEIAGAPKALRSLDTNGDGRLTEDELMPPRPDAFGPNKNRRSQNFDPDGPGNGMPPEPGGQGMGSSGGFGPHHDGPQLSKLIGAFTVTGKTLQTAAQAYASDRDDVSAVYVCNGGALTLISPTVTSTGNTSSQDGSSFFGLNAAVLADEKSRVAVEGGSITTSGAGANGAFATGKGAEIRLNGVAIRASGSGGHGVMATRGGTAILSGVSIDTKREHGAALATDRGGGTITACGGTYTTAGEGSPGIYSTGRIIVSNGVFKATGSEAAVIEGQNTIDLSDCTLVGGKLCGAMLYQSFSGDADGREGRFAMRRGSFTAIEGPLFRVTNAKGIISLSGVKLSAASGVLVCANTGRWGLSGANGGHAVLNVERQTLVGNLVCDEFSAIEATLANGSVLNGGIHGASLTLDATSTWSLTEDSVVAALSVPENRTSPVVAHIIGNGHNIHYDAKLAANMWLDGKIYALSNGGFLLPSK